MIWYVVYGVLCTVYGWQINNINIIDHNTIHHPKNTSRYSISNLHIHTHRYTITSIPRVWHPADLNWRFCAEHSLDACAHCASRWWAAFVGRWWGVRVSVCKCIYVYLCVSMRMYCKNSDEYKAYVGESKCLREGMLTPWFIKTLACIEGFKWCGLARSSLPLRLCSWVSKADSAFRM